MGPTLTQFVHQLLHAENLLNRMEISKTIIKWLTSPLNRRPMQPATQEFFIERVKVCALNPASKERQVIVEIAALFENHPQECKLPLAA